MDDVYFGLGSNVGDRLRFLADAVRALERTPSLRVVKVSGVYRTEPVGIKDQADFLNAAVWVQTSLSLHELRFLVKSIEKQLGRLERTRWGPREIDIDILMSARATINEQSLTVPHTEMNNRRFVLQPLAEIAPDAVHPVVHKKIAVLLQECVDTNAVERSEELTQKFLSMLKE